MTFISSKSTCGGMFTVRLVSKCSRQTISSLSTIIFCLRPRCRHRSLRGCAFSALFLAPLGSSRVKMSLDIVSPEANRDLEVQEEASGLPTTPGHATIPWRNNSLRNRFSDGLGRGLVFCYPQQSSFLIRTLSPIFSRVSSIFIFLHSLLRGRFSISSVHRPGRSVHHSWESYCPC